MSDKDHGVGFYHYTYYYYFTLFKHTNSQKVLFFFYKAANYVCLCRGISIYSFYPIFFLLAFVYSLKPLCGTGLQGALH